MKKLIYKLSFLGVLSIFAACSDFLETEPQDELSTDQAIGDLNDATVALTGAYSNLQSSLYLGRDFIVYQDVAADNAKISPDNSGRFLDQFIYSVTPDDENDGLWEQVYETIDRINNIIMKFDDGTITDGEQADRDDVLGQAYFLRAMCHFDLVRNFAYPYNVTDAAAATGANGAGGHLGVPYMFESVISEPARNTVAECYTNIITDLNNSYSLMAVSSNPRYTSKYAAKALLSRVYLYMDDYTNAIAAATDVIDNGGYSLVTSADYVDSWTQEASSESIFEIAMSIVDYPATNALGYIYIDEGYGDLLPTDEILNAIGANAADLRINWFKDVSGTTMMYKFPGRDGSFGLDNTPILRLSEVYLNRAEAYAKDNQANLAMDDLDMISQRSIPGIADYTFVNNATLIADILTERWKELAFEGHRKLDLVRNGLGVVRAAGDDIPYGDTRLAYPIPNDEINVNDNMVQNLGYN